MQGNSDQGQAADQIAQDDHHIDEGAPLTRRCDRRNSVLREVGDDADEIQPHGNACHTVDLTHDATQLACQQNVELGDDPGFRQDNGNGHEDQQVPGLVRKPVTGNPLET